MYRTLYSATWAQALNWLGWKDYSALRASPLRGRPSGVILPLLTHPLGPFLVDEPLQPQKLAGVEGFEPPYGGIKTRCLTAWRHPNESTISELARAGSQPAANLSSKGESFNPRAKNPSSSGGNLRTISNPNSIVSTAKKTQAPVPVRRATP